MHLMNGRFCLMYLFYTFYGYLFIKKKEKKDVKKNFLLL